MVLDLKKQREEAILKLGKIDSQIAKLTSERRAYEQIEQGLAVLVRIHEEASGASSQPSETATESNKDKDSLDKDSLLFGPVEYRADTIAAAALGELRRMRTPVTVEDIWVRLASLGFKSVQNPPSNAVRFALYDARKRGVPIESTPTGWLWIEKT